MLLHTTQLSILELTKYIIPVIESKTWSPIGSAKNRLNGTGKVRETIAHKKEPVDSNETFHDESTNLFYRISSIAKAEQKNQSKFYMFMDCRDDNTDK